MQRLIHKSSEWEQEQEQREKTWVSVFKCNSCGHIRQEFSSAFYNDPACPMCGKYSSRTLMQRYEL